jgi:phosphopantetheinyl transferase
MPPQPRTHHQEAEAARIRRFYHDKDRRLALGSVVLQRAAACWVLGDEAWSLPIERSAHNKPYLRTRGRRLPGWGFNVSHHGEWVVLASERDAAVGTDLVDLRDRPLEAGVTSLAYLGHFRRHLTPAEWDALVAMPDDGGRYRAFYRVWAVKEAYVKALGLGLSFPIRRVECPVVDVDRLAPNNSSSSGSGSSSSEMGLDEIMMDGYALADWHLEFTRLEPGGHYLWCTATGPPQPLPQGSISISSCGGGGDGDGGGGEEEEGAGGLPAQAEPITAGVSRQEEAALRGLWQELTLEECLPRGLCGEWERLAAEAGAGAGGGGRVN